MTSVRAADPGDVDTVVGLAVGLFREDAGTRDASMDIGWPEREGAAYYTRLIETELVLIADDGAGFLIGVRHPASSLRPVLTAELHSMYVRPEHRDRGVGSALVRGFLAWARERAAGRVTVAAFAANADAIRFYTRHGFTPHEITLSQNL